MLDAKQQSLDSRLKSLEHEEDDLRMDQEEIEEALSRLGQELNCLRAKYNNLCNDESRLADELMQDSMAVGGVSVSTIGDACALNTLGRFG